MKTNDEIRIKAQEMYSEIEYDGEECRKAFIKGAEWMQTACAKDIEREFEGFAEWLYENCYYRSKENNSWHFINRPEHNPFRSSDLLKLYRESKALADRGDNSNQEALEIYNEIMQDNGMLDEGRESLGNCMEKNCNKPAIKDYNGKEHFVCQDHYDSLNRYFESEYN